MFGKQFINSLLFGQTLVGKHYLCCCNLIVLSIEFFFHGVCTNFAVDNWSCHSVVSDFVKHKMWTYF